MRVQRTKILVCSCILQGERKLLLSVQDLGAESFVGGDDGMGDVVAIDPRHGGAGGNGQLRRREREVVDVHGGRGCERYPGRLVFRLNGPCKAHDQYESRYKGAKGVCWQAGRHGCVPGEFVTVERRIPRSARKRRIDDGERLVVCAIGHTRDAEIVPEFPGGHFNGTGRWRTSGGRRRFLGQRFLSRRNRRAGK